MKTESQVVFERTGSDDKRRVLEATDLVRLIGEHVALKRKGREWACLCPFHDDHNPSMYVVPHKQIYHCFVCGAGGDALSFIMNFHKMGFREALQLLADKGGVQLAPPPRRAGSAEFDAGPVASREDIIGANRAAQDFFRAILTHAEHGRQARELLERRGVSREMIELFGLGAAPARWDGLGVTIAAKKLDPAPFLAAGLIKQRESGGSGGGGGGTYDAMRNRLTFPIHDALGRVIAFGGRRIDDADEPKYLNSPETLIFNKSATLYGLPMASAAIREQGVAIVTEGYMDCIACHQAGVKNVVATLGTALTPLGARVLRRLCDRIVLLFDGDDAGQRAADRAIEVLFAEPVDVRIASMAAAGATSVEGSPGEGGKPPKDPDELLKQAGGVARFGAMISASVDALEHRFTRLRARTSALGLAARSRAIEDEIARLAELGLGRISPVRRHLIIRRIASLAGIPEAVVAQAIARQGRPTLSAPANPAPSEPAAKPLTLRTMSRREQLLACVLCDCGLLAECAADERAWLFAPAASAETGPDAAMGRLARVVRGLSESASSFDIREVTLRLDDPEAIRLATALVRAIESATDGKAERLQQTWADCLTAHRRETAEAAAPDDPLARLQHVVRTRGRFSESTSTFQSRK